MRKSAQQQGSNKQPPKVGFRAPQQLRSTIPANRGNRKKDGGQKCAEHCALVLAASAIIVTKVVAPSSRLRIYRPRSGDPRLLNSNAVETLWNRRRSVTDGREAAIANHGLHSLPFTGGQGVCSLKNVGNPGAGVE